MPDFTGDPRLVAIEHIRKLLRRAVRAGDCKGAAQLQALLLCVQKTEAAEFRELIEDRELRSWRLTGRVDARRQMCHH